MRDGMQQFEFTRPDLQMTRSGALAGLVCEAALSLGCVGSVYLLYHPSTAKPVLFDLLWLALDSCPSSKKNTLKEMILMNLNPLASD